MAGSDGVLWHAQDPSGDVRLAHPEAKDVQLGTFDLVAVTVREVGEEVEVTAELRSPVKRLPRPDVDGAWFLPTVDVYLVAPAGERPGRVDTPPGREVTVPSDAGWTHALVLSSASDLGDGVALPTHLTARGRLLIGRFPRSAAPAQVVAGYAAVLASAPGAKGDVRPLGVLKGDCATWDDSRCTLRGEAPPLLDVVGELSGQLLRPVGMPGGVVVAPEPTGVAIPAVFQRGAVLTVAPVPEAVRGRFSVGALLTVEGADGRPVGTAVVVSCLGDAATLQRLGEAPFAEARGVVLPAAP